ncbi:phage tail tape measure protein [Microbulbifer taiwanensis]|uniref:phage tail tape measure protein n=1 Tax=Microbulbifer taiwanensis TaxID=986746 RepID=UPI0036119C5C
MSTKLEKLLFRIGVIDKASGPLGKLDAQMQKLTVRTAKGMAGIAAGAAGLFTTGYALRGMLGPAIEMDRAIGEVRSLRVKEEAMDHLVKRARAFSNRYGEAADEIVRSSYRIQSAVQGIEGNQLGDIAYLTAMLAKGTKAESEIVSAFVGQTFNIFEDQAKAMGKVAFAEQVVGKTAAAVRLFNTDGVQMVEALKNLGKTAEIANIPLEEQLAVLGFLQNTMQMGSRAGTSYVAFLQSIAKAEDVLGTTLTNDQGRALPVLEIIDRIKAKLGDLGTAGNTDLLQKAFGKRGMSMVLAMSNASGTLSGNIEELTKLGRQQGLRDLEMMASAIADPWEKAHHAVRNSRAVFGTFINDALKPLLGWVTDSAVTTQRWMDLFPNVTRVVAYTTLGIIGLIGAVSLLAVVGGGLQLVIAGLSGFKLIWIGITKTATAVQWLYNASLKWGRAAVLAYHLAYKPKLLAAWTIGIKAAATSVRFLGTVLRVAGKATLLFSAALWANPITWIVAGVVALVAGLVLLVKHWDKVKAASLGFIQGLMDKWGQLRGAIEGNAFLSLVFAPLLAGVDLVSFLLRQLVKLPDWFGQFKAWLGGLDLFGAPGRAFDWLLEKWRGLRAAIEDNAFLRLLFAPLLAGADVVGSLFQQLDKIPQWFETFKNWLGKLNIFDALGGAADGLLSKLRLIPGIGKLLPKETPAPILNAGWWV